jgi:hypothetical protein
MLLYAQGGNINMDTKFPVQSASHNYAIYNGIFQTRIYALLRKHHLIPCLPYSIYSIIYNAIYNGALIFQWIVYLDRELLRLFLWIGSSTPHV